jgi:TolB-like protein
MLRKWFARVFLLAPALLCAYVADNKAYGLSAGMDRLGSSVSDELAALGCSRVAVVELTNLYGVTGVLESYLAEGLTYRLVDAGEIEVLERAAIFRFVDTEELTVATCIDPSVAAQLREHLGLDYVVAGTVAEMESTLVVGIRVIRLNTGVIAAVTEIQVLRDEAAALLDDVSPHVAAPRAASLRLEGESLRMKSITGGHWGPQDMSGFGSGWSNNAHGWWTGSKPGDRLDLELPVPPGRYAITMQLTKTYASSVVQFLLDGRPLGKPVDQYDDGVVPSGRMDFGARDIGKGEHVLSLKVSGANPKMRAHAGDQNQCWLSEIDYIDFARVGTAKQRREPGR